MSTSNQSNKDQEEFAYTTEAVTAILSAADFPKTLRDYIDCLIGIAGKDVEFDATDLQIEKRRKSIKSSGVKGKKEYWARDRRRSLLKWQRENHFLFLEYKQGDYIKKLGKRAPAHFKLYLVAYVQRVIAEAKKKKLFWNLDKLQSIKFAAKELIDELRAQPKVEPEDDYINPPDIVLQKLRSAKTNIAEAIRLLKKYDFQIYKENEAEVISIEKLLNEIRRRGFAELEDMKIFSGIKRESKP
jgi:hypothetical protein